MIPALRAGFVVLTDRYIYSLMARALVRGADPEWVRRVHDFALKPDIVVYLRVGIDELVTRVIQSEGFNYWESGMDLNLGEDLYESFVEYQKRLLREFENMAAQYNFQMIETSPNIEDVFEQIKAKIVPLLQTPR
jgi:dTMP kinase